MRRFGSKPAEKSGQNIAKNRCRTTIAEPIGETLAELPFIGDQVVCVSHDQAAWRYGCDLAEGLSMNHTNCCEGRLFLLHYS